MRVMAAVSKDGAVRSGSVPPIDQGRGETERAAVVDHQWGEGKKIDANDLFH